MTHDPLELYEIGIATATASWAHIARGTPGAVVQPLAGGVAAVFPHPPEADFYNNAVIDRNLDSRTKSQTIDEIELLYTAAGVHDFAVWAHETDRDLCLELERRRYGVKETTRAMGLGLRGRNLPPPRGGVCVVGWERYLEILAADGAPGLLAGVEGADFTVVEATLDGMSAGSAISIDHNDDCGVFNVGTVELARRRGLGTAMTAFLIGEATERGCRTATLQATPMAERLYRALGFEDLGQIREYAPARPGNSRTVTTADWGT